MESKKSIMTRFTLPAAVYFSTILIFFGLMTCFAFADADKDIKPKTETAVNADFFRVAAKPYRGVILHGLTENAPPSVYVKEVLGPMFEKQTGIKIDLQIAKDGKALHNDAIMAIENKTSNFDFLYIEQDFIYAYMEKGVLENLSALMEKSPALRNPGFKKANFTSFINYFIDDKGNIYGIPMESFLFVYIYRKDLFENPDIQKLFFEEYGYPLSPAITFQQYQDNARFFTDYGKKHNLPLWGTTYQGIAPTTHPASFYELIHAILPIFGVDDWGINTKTWKASVANGGTLNSRAAKDALEFWLSFRQWAPPESAQSHWGTVPKTMADGRAAQGFIYGDNISWVCTDKDRSTVVGKIGVALPPTASGVINKAKAGKGIIGYYDGAAFSIPVTSAKKEAALLWLQFVADQSIQTKWAMATARITNMETFDRTEIKDQDKLMGGYFSYMKKNESLYGGAPPFPFHIPLRKVMLPYIEKAMKGELSPSDAMDRMAADVDNFLAAHKPR